MDKIVGNIFLFLSITFFCIDAGIKMEVCTTDGVRRESVITGQPFLIEVTIDDIQGSVQAPTIHGLDKFFAKRTGMYMSSINGKSKTKYTYQVRIDQPGTFSIGPAFLRYQQKDLTSNSVLVTVSNDIHSAVVAQQQSATTQSHPELKVFLRLAVNADRVVIGQKMTAKLRFYYQDARISLSHIGQPELAGFDIEEIGKPVGGTETINGILYRYGEWQWNMYPTQAGEFVIPAYNADYELPHDNHFMGSLFMFVNMRNDRKRVYSNALKITVDPLPHYDGHVDAIGSFERFTAAIKPSIVKEGEAMVFSLEIEGNGNLPAIKPPLLSMPPALKYYDSNSTIIESTGPDHPPKKRFEFVVQGIKPGDWEIPAQTFTYFDDKARMYKKIHTAPLMVSVIASAHGHAPVIARPRDGQDAVAIIDIQEEIAPINTIGPWQPISERRTLPWWLFNSIAGMPFLYICYPAMRRIFAFFGGNVTLKKRKAYKEARKKIKQCIISGDDRGLYAIFMQLFAVCLSENNSLPFHVVIDEAMRASSAFSHEDIILWNEFFHKITHAAYALPDTDKNKNKLGRTAEEWLHRLEKIV